jgi:Big-like domain-containing protein
MEPSADDAADGAGAVDRDPHRAATVADQTAQTSSPAPRCTAMAWIKPTASAAMVVVFAVTVGLFISALRSSGPGGGLIPNLVTTVPADGARNVAVNGQIEIHYSVRPSVTPAVKLEPVAGVTLADGYWEGTTYVIPYVGLKTAMTYHAELDQDSSNAHGEHKQLTYRWSFTTEVKAAPPTPIPSIHPQPPTTTGPLIWYSGGGRLIAVDWQGTDGVGQLILTPALQSPDGSLLWYRSPPGPPGIAPRVFDRSGNAAGTLLENASAVWADDSRYICRVDGSAPAFYVQALGGAAQSVVSVPSGWPVACSWTNGRAVVAAVMTSNLGSGVGGMEVIQLADRAVLYQQRYPNPLSRLAASRDGLYAAEVYGWGSAPATTTIRDLTSGQPVVQLANFDARGFSWDGSLVVGVSGTQAPGMEIRVIDWRTERVVWRLAYPGDITSEREIDLHVLSRPNAKDFAVAFPYAVATGSGLWDLYVVHPDGSSKYVLRAPITPAF